MTSLRAIAHGVLTAVVGGVWSLLLVGAGYAGMVSNGRLGAFGVTIIAWAVTYAACRVMDADDRLTDALFASGFSLIALVGAALSISVEASVPFLVALVAWVIIDAKRRQDLDDADEERANDAGPQDSVKSEVSF